MKKPKLIPTKKPKLTTSQRLNAMARRAVQPILEEREEEPTMRFSTAFIIVFLLQAVAIGGIVMFNQIHKNHREPHEIVAPSKAQPAPESTGAMNSGNETSTVANREPQPSATPVAASAANRQVAPTSPLAASARSEGVQDSGKTYVVAKGDVPERIAKKFRVSYDDLLKLNKITDPRRLQIGQKLRIPAEHLAND